MLCNLNQLKAAIKKADQHFDCRLSIKSLGKAFGEVVFYPFLKIAVFYKMTFTQNYLHPLFY
jgi:hypothetical protein